MPKVALTPGSGMPGTIVRVLATEFRPNHGITATLDGKGVQTGPVIQTNGLGNATLMVTVPDAPAGVHKIGAAMTVGRRRYEADAPFLVIASAPPPVPTPPPYLFEDDFGDLANWYRDFHHLIGSTAAWDSLNSQIVNGQLVINVRRQADGSWSGDQLNTRKTFLYGRLGCRAKSAPGKGTFGAPMWAYGSGSNPDGSKWENEIDVVEIAGNPNLVHTTIHFPPTAKYPSGSLGHSYDAGVNLSLALHDYEADWIPPDASGLPQLVFYFDGKEIWRVPDADRNLIPTHALKLLTDNAVGGGWAGNPDSTTPSPTGMVLERMWVAPPA